MNMLDTIKELGRDILSLKKKQEATAQSLQTVTEKVTTSELDTGWIDIKALLESGGAWREVEEAAIRRVGNIVLFEVQNAKLAATTSHQRFNIGMGFSTPWQNFRATTGVQPPEVLLFMNRLHWIGFNIDGQSQIACRLSWVTTDPFPMDKIQK